MTTPRNDDNHALDPTLDLTLLAIQEQFLEEWRAGACPRLSVYAVRYPEHAAALADMVMRLEPDAQEAQSTSPERALRPTEPVPEPLGERFLSGAGAQRALEALFDAAAADDQRSRVAEQPASYDTRDEAPPQAQTPLDPSGD